MKAYLLAAVAAIAGLGATQASAADLDDDYVTRERIIERPVVERERVIVRRYVAPRYEYLDDDYYLARPRVVVGTPYWYGRPWHGPRHWHHHRAW